jgi:hypothetical protein
LASTSTSSMVASFCLALRDVVLISLTTTTRPSARRRALRGACVCAAGVVWGPWGGGGGQDGSAHVPVALRHCCWRGGPTAHHGPPSAPAHAPKAARADLIQDLVLPVEPLVRPRRDARRGRRCRRGAAAPVRPALRVLRAPTGVAERAAERAAPVLLRLLRLLLVVLVAAASAAAPPSAGVIAARAIILARGAAVGSQAGAACRRGAPRCCTALHLLRQQLPACDAPDTCGWRQWAPPPDRTSLASLARVRALRHAACRDAPGATPPGPHKRGLNSGAWSLMRPRCAVGQQVAAQHALVPARTEQQKGVPR